MRARDIDLADVTWPMPPTETWVNGDKVNVAAPATVGDAIEAMQDGEVVPFGKFTLEALSAAALHELMELEPVEVEVVLEPVTGQESRDPVERFFAVREKRAARVLASHLNEMIRRVG